MNHYENNKPHKPFTKVLLIDGSEDIHLLVRTFLSQDKKQGYSLFCVTTAKEAESHLHGQEFDIILLNLCLPDSQDLDTYHRIRQSGPRLPIVILSGNENPDLAEKIIKIGSQDLIKIEDLNTSVLTRSIRYSIQQDYKFIPAYSSDNVTVTKRCFQ